MPMIILPYYRKLKNMDATFVLGWMTSVKWVANGDKDIPEKEKNGL